MKHNEERTHSATGNILPIVLANSAAATNPPDLERRKTPDSSGPTFMRWTPHGGIEVL
jgi:hypothetical protein